MALVKRSSAVLIAIVIGMSLMSGVFAGQERAYAANNSVGAADAALTMSGQASAKASKVKVGEKLATFAAKLSYSRSVYIAKGQGTKAYLKQVRKMSKWYTVDKRWMQCNVPVAVTLHNSGVVKKRVDTCPAQYSFMKSSKDWKCIGYYKCKESMLKPGDVLIRKEPTSKHHVCMYVGKDIASSVYKKYLKGTDADKGKPGAKRTFMSAHLSPSNPATRSAACLQTQKEAIADSRMLVFRHR